jgi:hypothetical protein
MPVNLSASTSRELDELLVAEGSIKVGFVAAFSIQSSNSATSQQAFQYIVNFKMKLSTVFYVMAIGLVAAAPQEDEEPERPVFPSRVPRPTLSVRPPRPSVSATPPRPSGSAAPPRPSGPAVPPRPSGSVAPPRPSGSGRPPLPSRSARPPVPSRSSVP